MDCCNQRTLGSLVSIPVRNVPDSSVVQFLAMAATRAVKVELPSVSLKSVTPLFPKNKEEKEQLVEDLTLMGCKGLLAEPWTLRSEAMAQEFLQKRSNEWEGMIQREPERWTTNVWVEVYNFRKEGWKRAGRTNKWVEDKFQTTINPKDGHAFNDYIDPREQRVLEFVVPILYLEKLGRITKEVGNTIFGALA